MRERKVTVELTEAARQHLAKVGYDPTFGARPLARVIQNEIKDPLSRELLFGALQKGGSARVDFKAKKGKEGEFLFRFAADKDKKKPKVAEPA